jgi:hypothetical protein
VRVLSRKHTEILLRCLREQKLLKVPEDVNSCSDGADGYA